MLRRWSATTAPGDPNRTNPLDLEVLAALRAYQGESDADLATEVIDSYLPDLDRLIPEMRAAARERDHQQLKHIVHALKGCSASVGATGLVRLCQELGLMAALANAQTAELLIDQIATESGRVRDALTTQRIC
jgi:HPt (histidine-containing phosphotransfer) domain-containing protein